MSVEASIDFGARLNTWASETFGANSRVADVGSLGGHSGITIGFDVLDGTKVHQRLVLKMPPPGVARRNNFDVLRQVPLLQALEANNIPAPRACYWSDDESIFEAPYLMMSRLAGGSPPDLFRDDAKRGLPNATGMFSQAVDVLGRMHAIDVSKAFDGWDGHRHVDDEIEHWAKIFHKAQNPDWVRQGHALRDLLIETQPAHIPHGLTHGDYYSNNWVFDGERLSGVVDWEGATIGPSLLDVGWLYMIYDRDSWGPSRHRHMGWQPRPETLVARYIETVPRLAHGSLEDLGWYRALATYRIASITAYYFEEHRSGRRPNEAWEMFGEAFPHMIGNARRLLLLRRH